MRSIIHIITNILHSRNANLGAIQKQKDFEQIDAVLRGFVTALASGQTQMSMLISNEADSIGEHVTAETSFATSVLVTHVSTEAAKLYTGISTRLDLDQTTENQLHKRTFRSLKYEQMNSRQNMVAAAHNRTFEWIFSESAPVSCSCRY